MCRARTVSTVLQLFGCSLCLVMQAEFGFEDEVRGEMRKDTYRRYLQVDRFRVKSYISWVSCFQIHFLSYNLLHFVPKSDKNLIWKLGDEKTGSETHLQSQLYYNKANPTVRLF